MMVDAAKNIKIIWWKTETNQSCCLAQLKLTIQLSYIVITIFVLLIIIL